MKYKMLAMLAGVVLIPLATAVSWPRSDAPGGAVPTQMLGEGGTMGMGTGGSITGGGGITGTGGSITGTGGTEGDTGAGGMGGGLTGASGSYGRTYTGPTS
jgi:hypothetical protein